MKKLCAWLVLSGAAAAAGLLGWRLHSAPPVKAEEPCDKSSLRGPYGYTFTGNVNTAGVFGPFASTGKLTSDGEGRFTGSETVSSAGEIARRAYRGVYSVAPDCSGSAILNDNFGAINSFDFVIVNGGREVRFIQTDAGTVLTGSMNPQ
jgi:hypothetical protein